MVRSERTDGIETAGFASGSIPVSDDFLDYLEGQNLNARQECTQHLGPAAHETVGQYRGVRSTMWGDTR